MFLILLFDTHSQINDTQFAATKNCSSLLLSSACQILLTQLAIDWSGSVTWSDLRKPLYSGLAGALYTLLQLNGSAVPGDISLQAQFWATAFGGNETEFAVLAANATDFGNNSHCINSCCCCNHVLLRLFTGMKRAIVRWSKVCTRK